MSRQLVGERAASSAAIRRIGFGKGGLSLRDLAGSSALRQACRRAPRPPRYRPGWRRDRAGPPRRPQPRQRLAPDQALLETLARFAAHARIGEEETAASCRGPIAAGSVSGAASRCANSAPPAA